MNRIHPTALVDSNTKIGKNNSIGPYSVIGPNVELGDNNKIASHVVVEGNTFIGNNNHIFQFASVGAQTQDQKWDGEYTVLKIGDNNIIREYATLQPGTKQDKGVTQVGNNNLFMACSHVAHDCVVGDNCWIANCSSLAGHVTLKSNVIVGGLAGIHQFAIVGDFAFIAAGSMVSSDVPPFCMVQGDRAKFVQVNKVGLRRNNFSSKDILIIENIFKEIFYNTKDNLSDKIDNMKNSDCNYTKQIIEFITSSKRGIVGINKK